MTWVPEEVGPSYEIPDTVEGWLYAAKRAWREGDGPTSAAFSQAAATIASTMIFAQDAQEVALGMVQETTASIEQMTQGATEAFDRMTRAAKLLKDGKEKGPRNPYLLQALDILTGVPSDG